MIFFLLLYTFLFSMKTLENFHDLLLVSFLHLLPMVLENWNARREHSQIKFTEATNLFLLRNDEDGGVFWLFFCKYLICGKPLKSK